VVHQFIYQEDAATTWLEDVRGFQRIRDGTRIEAGAGIPNDDDHFPGFVAAHRALHVHGGVTAAPMADGVGDGFLKRELDRQNVLLRPVFLLQHLDDAIGQDGNRGGIGWDRHCELARRAEGHERTEPPEVRMRGAQFAHRRCLLGFRAIVRGEHLIQFDEIPPQFQLRFHLPAKRVERCPLIRR
jgi:hypothetical protein